jgi:hypothetical protein
VSATVYNVFPLRDEKPLAGPFNSWTEAEIWAIERGIEKCTIKPVAKKEG